MRDPKRIDEITQKLNELWHKYPDLRFWQLLCYLRNCIQRPQDDLFYLEDDKTLEVIDEMIRKEQ